jgi:uncharacterized protein (TIGR02118 family)
MHAALITARPRLAILRADVVGWLPGLPARSRTRGPAALPGPGTPLAPNCGVICCARDRLQARPASVNGSATRKGRDAVMVKLSVMYPQQDGKKFDLGYYLKNHFDLVKATWGGLIKESYVTRGVSGGAPGTKPAYHIMAHVAFASMDDLNKALATGAPLTADVPNFTDIQPVVQVSEVLG